MAGSPAEDCWVLHDLAQQADDVVIHGLGGQPQLASQPGNSLGLSNNVLAVLKLQATGFTAASQEHQSRSGEMSVTQPPWQATVQHSVVVCKQTRDKQVFCPS